MPHTVPKRVCDFLRVNIGKDYYDGLHLSKGPEGFGGLDQ
jgi:hypothetical protein